MRVSTWLTGLGLLCSACDAPPLVGRGGKCHSLSDCDLGLTCVAGRCSTDLASLQGEVPTYEELDAGALDAEAGVLRDAQVPDASAPRADASVDASAPREAGAPDSAVAQPDSAVAQPDSAVLDAAASDASEADAGDPDAAAVSDAGPDV
jgi:hypothetical protein